MATENEGQKPPEGTPPKPDSTATEIGALKGQLNQITDMLKKQQQTMRPMAAPKTQTVTTQEVPDPVYAPDAYARYIAAQVDARTQAALSAQNEKQGVIAQLVSQYPELSDASSELTKRAVEIYETMSDQERSLSSSYKTAVLAAAADQGVLPVNKRPKKTESESEDFTVSSSSGSESRRREREKRSEDQIDEKTLAFAELMGRPIDDPKYIERLKTAAKRRNWGKYE